jgi:putative ABC transport system ATP-binding protein
LNLLNEKSNYNETDIAFQLVPKLNAVGRLADIIDVNQVVKYLCLDNTSSIDAFSKEMIKINDLRKEINQKMYVKALENVNLMVEKGEFLSIMGPSGCGKSTLLNIMGLLDAPTSGIIQIAGVKVEGMKDKELAAFRNRNLGFVFQSFHLINSLNVLDNVELPLLYRDVSAKERRRLAEEVLLKVGLSHRMHHMPSQLSGGQCQRVAIARAIVGNPEIVLADEPTGNLDSRMGAEIMEILHKLNQEDGRTIIMVTHNEEQAKQTSRIVRFFDGRQVG